MALFNKIFFQSSSSPSSSSSSSSTSSSTSSSNSNKQSIHSKNYISQFPFNGGQVRILLFRECDSRGRRLLFDSNALQKVSLKDFEIKLSNTHNIIDDNISIKSDINAGKQPLKGHVNGFVETSDGFLYRHNRPNSMDIPSIGEMVFGALAMSFRGTALKVHWLRSPTRMLCSQVFLSPTNVTNNSITPHHISADHLTPRNSITSDHGSVDGFSMNSFCIGRKNSNVSEHIGERPYCTNPLDVPDASFDNGIPRYSATYSTGDSGYSGGTTSNDHWTITTSSLSYQYSTRSSIGSAMSDAESMRKFSLDSSFFPSTTNSNVSSDGSLQRRISRNLLTSFENQNSLNDFIGFLSDNNFHGAGTAPQTTGGSEGSVAPQYRRASCTNESRSNPEIGRRRDISHFHKASRRAKLGLAVCITMSESFEEEMELFCSEHIALLESMLGRLRLSSEKAYINHKDFLQIMVHAWQATTQWIVDLFTAPRISVPVWLSITTSGSKHSKTVADRFIRDLCLLLSVADTKDTNFFVSTVLTAILTHHLGWVSTISNINSPSKSRAAAIEQRAKLLEVSQKYPYNVLWAQMGDLYGAVGIPPKLSRTIIYGTEKLHTERLLNILTYFIRCGEVRRSTKKEVFNKDRINDLIMNQTNDQSSAKGNSFSSSARNSFSSTVSNSASSSSRSLGLTRNATCKTNLNTLTSSRGNNISSDQTDTSAVNIHKKNDIPNVLAFRESRLVQQELRIGNFSMDPGITKSSLNNRKEEGLKRDRIKLTITTPENIEVTVEPSESDESNIEDVVEAIEIDSCEGGDHRYKKHGSFWSLPVKEGLCWGDLNKLPNLPMNRKLEKRSTSCNVLREIEKNDIDEYSELKPIGDKHISLSVLITENSVGKSERLTWGIEPFKEAISLEEEQHFEIQQKIVEKERGITKDKNSVVFVLGENEALVNIKRSNEDLSEVDSTSQSTVAKKAMCPHHHHKKHSGVKFDFAQYPQIYANYMKSKNLSDCDFMEKPQKLENLHLYGDNSSLCSAGTSSLPPIIKEEEVLTEYCEICQNSSGSKSYQTPSNATELEFDTDDDHSVYNNQSFESNSGSRTLVESRNVKVKRGVKPSEVNVIVLPVPGTKEQEMEEDAVARCDMKLKAGFIPSLFLNMSDHYVSDMVLQGTSAPPHQWEANIKEDLTLATHSASLISARAENVAVIADMDKWDVKIISPQNQMLPYSNVVSGPVGMSQLVASMLETVYTMNNSGISSYDCLSFLESKLQEIYMHSEALAAFLLETDFCSLNAVTSALNLTENDVPLLLSVASIHTPQISKKCGISFR